MKHLRVRAPLAAAAALAWTLPAQAGSFAEDGSFAFDPASVSRLDFEAAAGEGGQGGGGASSSASSGGGATDPPPALHGAGSLELMQFQGVDLAVDVLAERRTYRVSAWVHGGETNADLEVTYPGSASVDELAALYPTGRMTSDGWIEMANDHVRIEGDRGPKVTVGLFSPSGSRVDAIELVPDGELAPDTVNQPCGGLMHPGTCGAEQLCIYSVCRNMGGSVPPIPADRDDVADYMANRLRFLFGPNLERALDFPSVENALTQMKLATDKWAYWNGLMLAIRRLHDGHTTTSSISDFVLQNKKPITACFIEGDADLTHGVAPKDPAYLDVLVSHTGADHALDLRPGDRLVSIDGEHPIAWARSLVDVVWGLSPTSNHRTFAELAEQLRGLIARYAHEIAVIRCDATAGTCDATPETIVIAELPTLAAGEAIQSTSCDNRPLRHLPSSPANHDQGSSTVYGGIVNDSDATEGIYGIEWESLYTTNGSDGSGAALKQNVALWKASANGVILDHRSGNGGTMLANQILWAFNAPQKTMNVYLDRQIAEAAPLTQPEALALFELGEGKGFADVAGTPSPTTIPMALLLTRDVSASDWLPLGYKGAPGVRIFAPFETNGGFSTRYAFGYWLGMSYVIAVGDSIDPDGRTLNGTGVSPDEIVLPKQSDLLMGRDTLYEAGLAWVRSQLP